MMILLVCDKSFWPKKPSRGTIGKDADYLRFAAPGWVRDANGALRRDKTLQFLV